MQSPTGVYYNLAVHSVYLQLLFLRRVEDITVMSARTGRFPSAFAEELRVLLRGEQGLGYLCFSLDIQPHLNALHVYGTKGTLLLDLNTMTLLCRLPSRLPKLLAKSWGNVSEALQLLTATGKNALGMVSGKLRLYPGIRHVILRFHECLANGTPPPVSAEEGYEVVRLMDQIHHQGSRIEPRPAHSHTTRGVA